MNGVMRWLRTPKGQLLVIFAMMLAIVAPSSGGRALVPSLLAAVIPACLIDGVWLAFESRRWRAPTSALLSSLIVFFILSTNESWLVVGWTSCFAILSKRILRSDREQVFNPAALALLWAPIAFGSGESWWGAFGDLPMVWVAVLLAAGIFLTDRLNKFPLVLSFLAAYFGFFALVALGNPSAVAEMFREPFLQAALFLAFFMLTDPPTSPNRYGDQFWFGLLAALAAGTAQLLGAGQVFLLVGVLVSNAVLAVVRFWRRRSVVPAETQPRGTQTPVTRFTPTV
ncbi:MAG TPA: RnfABCDGE type electron transport complex subunit D [Chloroflexota bacterium]|nr:RnfABCDGE type electron transport complex subunit D [Chloroflexota bacterium]